MEKITIEAPIKTVSEANCSEHWTKKAIRRRQQQAVIRLLLNGKKISLPCTVRMIRLSPNHCDDDNLRIALKGVRDELSECIVDNRKTYLAKNGKVRQVCGRNDDNPEITWQYDQEKARLIGLRIEITCRQPDDIVHAESR